MDLIKVVKRLLFSQANSGFHLSALCKCSYSSLFSLACVAWRFWLGALSNKGGRGQRNREEIGAEATWGFYFSRGFAARSRALRARISRLRRSCARLNKTAMLRRLSSHYFLFHAQPVRTALPRDLRYKNNCMEWFPDRLPTTAIRSRWKKISWKLMLLADGERSARTVFLSSIKMHVIKKA